MYTRPIKNVLHFYRRCKQSDRKCPLDVKAAISEAFQSHCVMDTSDDESLSIPSDEDDLNEHKDFEGIDQEEVKLSKKIPKHEDLETSSDKDSDTPNKCNPCSSMKLSENIKTEPILSPIAKNVSPFVKSSSKCHSLLSPVQALPCRRSKKRLHYDYSPDMPSKKRKLDPLSETDSVVEETYKL